MLDNLRTAIRRRCSLQQVARLDPRLRDDIGMGHVGGTPDRDRILLLARGPFERYSS